MTAVSNFKTPFDDPAIDEDIHGKLAHLNALPLDKLTLAKRYAYITLLYPPNSDELGRFMTHGGALPMLPALSDREARLAIDGLIADELLRKWQHGGSDCYELAGAYAYKAKLKEDLAERRRLGIQKKQELLKRKQRKKDAAENMAFVFEDDGSFSQQSPMVKLTRSARGNLLPTRHGVWFRSVVPPPPQKGARHKMLLDQPNSADGCILRMLPSFNPAEEISALGVVLRFYLLMNSDDYGRVALDVNRLHQQLGPVITKRVSKSEITSTLREMVKNRYLIDFNKNKKWFAYIQDSAQHMLTVKRYDRNIPKLYDDREFTYDSERYRAFFQACEAHKSSRTKVYVADYAEKGTLKYIEENVEIAAKRFVKNYELALTTKPFCNYTPERLMQANYNTNLNLIDDHYPFPIPFAFYYGVVTNRPVKWLEQIYDMYASDFDGTPEIASSLKTYTILSYLLRMTPYEYIQQAKKKNEQQLPQDDVAVI